MMCLEVAILFMTIPWQSVFAISEKNSIRNSHLILAGEEGPFFGFNDKSSTEPYWGPVWTMLKYLQEALNFTFEVKRPHDGSVGYIYENGSWSGMIGMVNRSVVDFGFWKSLDFRLLTRAIYLKRVALVKMYLPLHGY